MKLPKGFRIMKTRIGPMVTTDMRTREGKALYRKAVEIMNQPPSRIVMERIPIIYVDEDREDE